MVLLVSSFFSPEWIAAICLMIGHLSRRPRLQVMILKHPATGSGEATPEPEQEAVTAALLLVCPEVLRLSLIVLLQTIPPLAVWVELAEMEASRTVEMKVAEVTAEMQLVTVSAAESTTMAKAAQS
jgi:hypothetical protein